MVAIYITKRDALLLHFHLLGCQLKCDMILCFLSLWCSVCIYSVMIVIFFCFADTCESWKQSSWGTDIRWKAFSSKHAFKIQKKCLDQERLVFLGFQWFWVFWSQIFFRMFLTCCFWFSLRRFCDSRAHRGRKQSLCRNCLHSVSQANKVSERWEALVCTRIPLCLPLELNPRSHKFDIFVNQPIRPHHKKEHVKEHSQVCQTVGQKHACSYEPGNKRQMYMYGSQSTPALLSYK